MPTPTQKPVTTPIPVQLSEVEFNPYILPQLGYHRLFLWVLYTGMQWKCLPVPKDHDGKAQIHYTTVYRAFAKWSDDGSLELAFIASVQHLADHQQLDLSVLHGFDNLLRDLPASGIMSRSPTRV
jgi:hypothetical protein